MATGCCLRSCGPMSNAVVTDSVSMRSEPEATPLTSSRSLHPTSEVTAPTSSWFSKRRSVVILAALLSGLGGFGYYRSVRGIESTDNAQVDADVVAVPARVGGVVLKLYFTENQRVAKGALLAELDAAPLSAKLAQAEASLLAAQASAEAAEAEALLAGADAVGNRDVARANLTNNTVGVKASSDAIREGEAQLENARAASRQSELDLTRAKQLFASGAFTRSQLDSAQTAHERAVSAQAASAARLSGLRLATAQSQSRVAEASARLKLSDNVDTLVREAKARAAVAHANVETARAVRDLAALDLSYTKVVAPEEGVVSKKSVNAGQSLASGQTIVQLVTDARWVTANFKETQLEHMRAGQPVQFSVDAYPGVALTGDVESFSGATGARFTLLPPDNATGNFTKVVQRVPVRIHVRSVPHGLSLRPGMSVELDVDTNEHG
ncbi:MAG TPA: HlyD family secretion protein [Polyangiales bacterium]|nr:HlyD family secretion protein [Polyangiales bacterium]